MKFIASLFYFYMRFLVYLVTRTFYSKFTIINKDRLKFKNPALVISNHPSTLLDPLNVGVSTPRQLSFLANAGLFKNPAFGAFLKLYCIPIERPKDVEGRRIQNDDNFARADRHLSQGHCIYVAAEGTSVVERRIRKVKTGSARIALSAENKNDFNLGTTILPIGLTYTDPLKFRSEVLLNVGKPLKAKDYQKLYKDNPVHAAKKMTADLQQELEALVFHTTTDEQDVLLSQIQIALQSETPMPPKEHFLRSKKIHQTIINLSESDFKQIKENADGYFNILKKNNFEDKNVLKVIKNHFALPDIFNLILGFPIFIYGLINNFFAFFIPAFLAKKLKIYHGYIPAVMTLSGMVLVPLFYIIQSLIVNNNIKIPYSGWIYLLSLLPMAWLAWQYRTLALDFFKYQKVKTFKKKSPSIFEELVSKRNIFLAGIKKISER